MTRLFDTSRLRNHPIVGSFWLLYSIALVACIALQLSGLSIGRWGTDAGDLIAGIETGGAVGVNSSADRMVVLLTPYLGFGPVPNLLPTVLMVFIICRVAFQANNVEKFIIAFLSFPLIFQLQFVSKEAIVTVFMVLIYCIYALLKQPRYRHIFLIFLMILMSLSFRQYYFVSLAFMAAILLLKRPSLFIPAVIFGVMVVAFIPALRDPLLDAKYLVYRNVSTAASSLIPMYFTGYNPKAFIGNYFFSIPFYSIPFLVAFRVQELYMQIYIIFCSIVAIRAFNSGDKYLAAMFLGISFTFPVFIAEVGTLARHLSGIIPLTYLSLFHAPTINTANFIKTDMRKRQYYHTPISI